MIVKTCSKCGNKFSNKEKFYSLFPKYRGITCSSCGARYKVSLFSRLLIAALMTAPTFAAYYMPVEYYNESVVIFVAYASI